MTNEEKVKQKYPDAYCIIWATAWDDGYVVIVPGMREIGGGDTRHAAWADAARRIEQ